MKIRLMGIMLMCWGLVATAGADICDNLKGYWPMDEGTGTVVADSSICANEGEVITGESDPNWQSGILGNCLYFDGFKLRDSL